MDPELFKIILTVVKGNRLAIRVVHQTGIVTGSFMYYGNLIVYPSAGLTDWLRVAIGSAAFLQLSSTVLFLTGVSSAKSNRLGIESTSFKARVDLIKILNHTRAAAIACGGVAQIERKTNR